MYITLFKVIYLKFHNTYLIPMRNEQDANRIYNFGLAFINILVTKADKFHDFPILISKGAEKNSVFYKV